jgi:prepilin-type N-terminal cleavage/methylation domain-containing protein
MNNDTRSQRRTQSGFTIVETLIVIAVSASLLLSAIYMTAGKQRKVEFNQSAQDIQSVIQQVASETASGHYANGNNFSCSATSTQVSFSTSTPTAQGSNTNCIFLGRAIQFGNNSDQEAYVFHTIAGYKNNDGSIDAAVPTAIDLDSAREYDSIHNGVKVVKMRYVDGANSGDVSGVAFLQGLGDVDSNSNFISGAQQTTVVPLRNSGNVTNNTVPMIVASIKNQINSSAPINPSGGVQICLQSGGTSQWALITVGSNGRGLSVTLDYKSAVCW